MVAVAEWVVIAEPNVGRATRLQHFFETRGFAVELIKNGDEILPTLERTPPPSLVVVNLTLPVRDGLSVLRELTRTTPHLPVLALGSVQPIREAAANLGHPNVVVLEIGTGVDDVEQAAARLLKRTEVRAHKLAEAPASLQQEPWIQQYVTHLAQEMGVAFDVRLVIVGVTIAGHTWCGISVQPMVRPVALPNRFIDWPLIREATEAREMLVIPSLRDHIAFHDVVLPPGGTFQGVAVMPMISGTGTVVGAVCLLDLEPLRTDAGALQVFETRVRAATAEIERTLAAKSYAHQVNAFRQQMDGQRAEADARIAALSRVALRDALTGLFNRRGGEEALDREIARANRTRAPLSVVLLDIDHFKGINDTHGHGSGDRVLIETSQVIRRLQRGSDFGVRWGGEEFLIVLPDIDIDGARTFGERIRSAIEALDFGEVGRITVSGGAAEFCPGEKAAEAVARADRALYQAKMEGRNRIS